MNDFYEYSTIVGDDFYVWKSHISCKKLASKLDMFHNAGDDGVGSDFFYESVINEYNNIIKGESDSNDFYKMLEIVKEKILETKK